MSAAERRRTEAAFVRALENFEEIKSARAVDLHIPSGVTARFSEEFIVLTPMNLAPPDSYMMLSRYDYVLEHAKFLSGGAQWDDSSRNRAQVGDLFAFVFFQPAKGVDRMELFKIVDILSVEHRRENWVITEHANRRVLNLSRYIGRVSYSSFAVARGFKMTNDRPAFVRGTFRTKWPKNLEVEIQGHMEGAVKEEEKEEEKRDVVDLDVEYADEDSSEHDAEQGNYSSLATF